MPGKPCRRRSEGLPVVDDEGDLGHGLFAERSTTDRGSGGDGDIAIEDAAGSLVTLAALA